MKSIEWLLFKLILIVVVLFPFKSTSAQISVSFNLNAQPLWGPANHDYVEYYYIPEAEVYYSVPTNQYIYLNHGEWISVSTLPSYYHIDLYRTYKVVINEPRPYMRHQMYREKYSKYKHSYNKQSSNRAYKNSGRSNSRNGNSNHHNKKGKGHK